MDIKHLSGNSLDKKVANENEQQCKQCEPSRSRMDAPDDASRARGAGCFVPGQLLRALYRPAGRHSAPQVITNSSSDLGPCQGDGVLVAARGVRLTLAGQTISGVNPPSVGEEEIVCDKNFRLSASENIRWAQIRKQSSNELYGGKYDLYVQTSFHCFAFHAVEQESSFPAGSSIVPADRHSFGSEDWCSDSNDADVDCGLGQFQRAP